MGRFVLSALLLCSCLATAARADVVVLRNGSQFEGEVVVHNKTFVILRVAGGTISFRTNDVKEIRKAPWTPPAVRSDSKVSKPPTATARKSPVPGKSPRVGRTRTPGKSPTPRSRAGANPAPTRKSPPPVKPGRR